VIAIEQIPVLTDEELIEAWEEISDLLEDGEENDALEALVEALETELDERGIEVGQLEDEEEDEEDDLDDLDEDDDLDDEE
jgi:hypothetical protein